MRKLLNRQLRLKHVLSAVLLVAVLAIGAQRAGWLPGSIAGDKAPSTFGDSLAKSSPGLYKIDHFIDGDTISVNMNGHAESVRFIGVDTPETHKPNTPVQCYGELAAGYTKSLIGSGKVRLSADSLSSNRDRYNRLLRYVYLPDGRLIDELLIQNGYGFAYVQFPFTKSATFSADQTTAQSMHKGLWSVCRPYQEAGGRWQANTAEVSNEQAN